MITTVQRITAETESQPLPKEVIECWICGEPTPKGDLKKIRIGRSTHLAHARCQEEQEEPD